MKPRLTLPPKWRDRSSQWAERSVLGYERGEKERSRTYARPGIDKSVDAQYLGKAGECIYCLHFGIDPERLDWSPRCDSGIDVVHLGLSIDVKASNTEFLMWPVTKNKWLDAVRATIFALVRRIDKPADLFEMSGWVSVKYFIANHNSAPPPKFLDAGTKHLHESELWPSSIFEECAARNRAWASEGQTA